MDSDQSGFVPSSFLNQIERMTLYPLEETPTPNLNPRNIQIEKEQFEIDTGNLSQVNITYVHEVESIEFSLMFQVCIYILYNVVFVAAVLGNILVIYVVASSVRMRTVTNYLIANLALGDLLMALLCVPFSYISVLLQYWPFGLLLCHLVSPAQAVCVFVSAYTLVALAIDRYMAILYPLRPRLRRSQALIVIALIWIIALFTAVPIALFTRLKSDAERGLPLCEESGWEEDELKLVYSLTLMILQYFFPISVLIFTYTRIAIAVWGKKAPGEAENVRDQRLAKAKRKTVVMTLMVVVGYTLAWLPLNLFQLYLETIDPEHPPAPYIEYIFFACHWLAMAHTTYNPIIYAWINIKFRAAFTQVLNKCRPSWISHKSSSYSSSKKTNSRSSKSMRTTVRGESLINNKGLISIQSSGQSKRKGQLL